MRRPLVVGNWKLHHGPGETTAFLKDLSAIPVEVDVGLAPTTLSLAAAAESRPESLLLFAQNTASKNSGALTGENSAAMLRDIGIDGTLLGHSERRQYFGETDASINERLLHCVSEGFKTILCIGETLDQRENGRTEGVVEHQLGKALEGVTVEQMPLIAIAYEPVWAIGTGKTATAEQAEEVHAFLREWLWNKISQEVASQARIIYGGSVKPAVARELLSQPNIDGFLIGGASLKIEDFVSIIQTSNEVVEEKKS